MSALIILVAGVLGFLNHGWSGGATAFVSTGLVVMGLHVLFNSRMARGSDGDLNPRQRLTGLLVVMGAAFGVLRGGWSSGWAWALGGALLGFVLGIVLSMVGSSRSQPGPKRGEES